ncbi:MAG TPA: ParB N-terminal domain-containing protein [Rhodanobacteraceae bacterium]
MARKVVTLLPSDGPFATYIKMARVDIETIEVGDRLRVLDPAKVDTIKRSIEADGIINPITVRETPDGYALIAGRHRLEAMRALEWMIVPVSIVEADDLHAELLEIDENIARNDLTAQERDQQIERRQEIWDQLHPHGHQIEHKPNLNILESGTTRPTLESETGSVHVVNGAKGGRGKQQFASETAAVSGQSKRDVNRAIFRAEHIKGKAAKSIAGTPLADNASFMDRLAKVDGEDAQVEYVKNELARRADKAKERAAKRAATAKVRKEAADDDASMPPRGAGVYVEAGDGEVLSGKAAKDRLGEQAGEADAASREAARKRAEARDQFCQTLDSYVSGAVWNGLMSLAVKAGWSDFCSDTALWRRAHR